MKWISNKYFIAFIILLILGIWMLPALFKDHQKIDPIKENFTPPVFNVLVERVNLQSIRPAIRLSGVVKSDNNLIVRSQTSGKVKKNYVKRGNQVSKDSLLIELDEEDFNATLDQAKSNYQTQNINYQSIKSLFDKDLTSKINLSQAESNLKNAKAQLDKAQLNFDHRFIKSDFDGEVNEVYVELGDFVSVGQNLVEILDMNNLKIEAELLPDQLRDIQQSGIIYTNLEVFIDHPFDSSNNPIKARLNFVSKKANPNSRSYPIEVKLNNSVDLFALEQWVSFNLYLNEQMAYPIKRSLMNIDQDGHFGVALVNSQNQVEQRKVKIIQDNGDQVWVVGLNQNETLITRGSGFVESGDFVNIVGSSK